MSAQQLRLLKLLIEADREENPRERWIEVGRFVGIELQTVASLDELVETEGRENSQVWARLRRVS